MTTTAREPVLVIAGALVALACVEAAVQRVSPVPPPIMEVDDGVREYAASDPDTLVLGSSHTRSFAPMRDMVAERTHGAHRMALVPVEWGTFGSYQWVLDHRIRPLIEERDPATGALKRGRLRRAILVTTFYDLCRKPGLSEANLPARAWTFGHFADDVAAHGLNDFNGNFLQTRLADALPFSALVQDRGHGFIVSRSIDFARGVSPDELAERRRYDLDVARARMEEQYAYCDDPGHKRSLRETIDYLHGRRVEVTLVLFPLLPDIVSARSRETTLRRYERYVADLAREVPVRVTDMTLDGPFTYGDFQSDLDHLNREGNRKFSRWALDGHMAWLLDAPVAPPAVPP